MAVRFNLIAVLCKLGQHFVGEAQMIYVHVINESRVDPTQRATIPNAFSLLHLLSPLSCQKWWEAKRMSLVGFNMLPRLQCSRLPQIDRSCATHADFAGCLTASSTACHKDPFSTLQILEPVRSPLADARSLSPRVHL